ncbi:MAG: phosphoadenosine phosphosulfate reductase family protein [Atribacterota bacterium]|nr:phosphoadenosine phosphosulfate reductase family protein [Atribacterota bacterium]MDD4896258.1 phosphoadenosine phosphosulfate reductase family protein [Atribacterota bacterium]MDD5636853.1 phosphoadenosine phosphosulfate reductase family protein [Atribacterota bacterium]
MEQDAWLEALDEIRERLQEDAELEKRILRLRNETREKIARLIKDKKVALSWSGGKDSIVLQHICEGMHIKRVFWVRCNLEYQQVLDLVSENAPENLEVVNTGQDLRWLSENEHLLFPQQAEVASIWFKIVQNEGQKRFFQRNNLDMILVGRRTKDGNDPGEEGMDVDEYGVVRYAPIYNWNHEDLLAYLEYFDIQLPPFYFWTNGFQVGTGPWAAREYTGSIENGWREVFKIEPQIVEKAAHYLKSASEFLKNNS